MPPAHSAAPQPRLATAVNVSPPEPQPIDSRQTHTHGATTAKSPASRTTYRWLLLLFVLSLSLMNPWVRGDGVGYYAFARALLIGHNLDFAPDYESANASFRDARLDDSGVPKSDFRTATNHLDNHFTIGPAILWSPFLIVAHVGVLAARAFGSNVAADGFSAPYRFAMALGTAFYGFAGLLLAMRIAAKYAGERWAFLATIAIWWATSLPVYMYFNPSWSHAHSAFAVALFLWYWHETRSRHAVVPDSLDGTRDLDAGEHRSTKQWLILGAIAGLMLNVYYANAMVLFVLVVEAAQRYLAALRNGRNAPAIARLAANHVLFAATMIACMLPTFVTRYFVYGSPFASGYIPLKDWAWRSPYFLAVLFSANHGLFIWTPVIALSCIGVVIFALREPRVGGAIFAATLAFYLLIACYPDWAGISSYGNRFFVSLTPIFILGFSVLLSRAASLFRSQRAALATASCAVGAFILWNMAFIFQWGTHLVPARGPIVWSEMIHNQFSVVPQEIAAKAQGYLFHRSNMMRQIEQRDIEQMNKK